MGIFDKREAYKPFEYPEVTRFIDAMNKSYWVHSEVEFTADVQDYKVNLTDVEREALKRSLLGIAQIEVSVKTFWGDLYKMFPKPEFNGLGMTNGESEHRHSEAYSRLLEVLGCVGEFENILDIPVFKKRYHVLKDYLNENKDNVMEKLLFFTLVVENASLFSQFATILYFSRFKGYMKNVANIIAWSSIDELNHSLSGTYILNIIFSEKPEMRNKAENEAAAFIQEYIKMEDELLDWIFEQGELDHVKKKDLGNYMRYRLNNSFKDLKLPPPFELTEEDIKPMMWFEEEVFSNELDDFFAKRPVAYTKHDKSITANDLF